jgi:hypothetical protein
MDFRPGARPDTQIRGFDQGSTSGQVMERSELPVRAGSNQFGDWSGTQANPDSPLLPCFRDDAYSNIRVDTKRRRPPDRRIHCYTASNNDSAAILRSFIRSEG